MEEDGDRDRLLSSGSSHQEYMVSPFGRIIMDCRRMMVELNIEVSFLLNDLLTWLLTV